jgi:hypothetical protein
MLLILLLVQLLMWARSSHYFLHSFMSVFACPSFRQVNSNAPEDWVHKTRKYTLQIMRIKRFAVVARTPARHIFSLQKFPACI